ncbi:1866_t:CDS:1, partial [Acaulospora colombiana]
GVTVFPSTQGDRQFDRPNIRTCPSIFIMHNVNNDIEAGDSETNR